MPKPNRVTLTAPKRIWLQVSEDKNDRKESFPPIPDGDITWAAERVLSCEVEYVRADLARATKRAVRSRRPTQ